MAKGGTRLINSGSPLMEQLSFSWEFFSVVLGWLSVISFIVLVWIFILTFLFWSLENLGEYDPEKGVIKEYKSFWAIHVKIMNGTYKFIID